MINPIFIEYYSHESSDCYKILLPWPRFKEEKIVLCKVSDGVEKAKIIARGYIVKHLETALTRDITQI